MSGAVLAAALAEFVAELRVSGYWPPPGVGQPNPDGRDAGREGPQSDEPPRAGWRTPEKGVKPVHGPHRGQDREIPRKRPA